MTATMKPSAKPTMKPAMKSPAKPAMKSITNTASAPQTLATPTDLGAEQVRAISECVNILIADTLALYLKTKNFHWHLSGSHFKEYHELFDDQADQLLESVDVLAERVRKLGATTLRSISHVTGLQKIIDDHQEAIDPLEMVQRLLNDNKHMVRSQRAAIKVCDTHGDSPTSNILQTLLDESERRVWFLFETTRDSPVNA
jgi:starvation-inducible DNA-binding protein